MDNVENDSCKNKDFKWFKILYMPLTLNKQEYLVLKEIINGKTNNYIATKLFLSKATVKNIVSVLIQKLKVKNRVQLAVLGTYFILDNINFN